MNRLIFVVVAISGAANAGTVQGEKAEPLTHVLRYAGITPTVAKTVHTFKLPAVECVRSLDPDGANLDDYHCTLGKTELKDLPAYELYTALESLGVQVKPVADTKIQLADKNVSCAYDSSKGFEDRYTCTSDGIRAKPTVITGKKVPVKDIVQPVKIEKQ